ncbi:XRE family transcriptional regulator [uncultured Megasphaera sp.]|nr:XRE family transcriptional regulator [uncultured Megasphaera sp.]
MKLNNYVRLGNIIKAYRIKHDLSLADFSRMSGLSKAYIGMLEKGTNPGTGKEIIPTTRTINAIAKAMKISSSQLFDMCGGSAIKLTDSEQKEWLDKFVKQIHQDGLEMPDGVESLADLSNYIDIKKMESIIKEQSKIIDSLACDKKQQGVKIPVLGSIIAGIPVDAIQDIIDWEEIPREMATTGEFFGLKVKGHSMEPRILEGDVVIVKRQADVESGKVAVVLINGNEAMLKRVKKQENGITLIANNISVYAPHFYTNDEIEKLPVHILGEVVELRGKGKF